MDEGRAIDGGEIRDVLPDDLNAVDHLAVYRFPDNSRRRIPGAMYLVLAAVCALVGTVGGGAAWANDGWFLAAAILGAMGLLSVTSGWRMTIDESEALVVATRSVGFAVGHASAQQVWHGLRSRPTWRIFCYSAEDPPLSRGLVLVDAVNGAVVQRLVEANPDGVVAGSSGPNAPAR